MNDTLDPNTVVVDTPHGDTPALTLEQLNKILTDAGDKPVTAEDLEHAATTQEDFDGPTQATVH